jgi:2,4-dienoyl-CoA reductase-like NADH-dependent reductase (Old Yellow Enzyme family)
MVTQTAEMETPAQAGGKAAGAGRHEICPTLFTPAQIGGLALRNRIAMSPMTRSFSVDHVPGADVVEYYRRRAQGGVGLIFTEGTYISHSTSGDGSRVPRLESENTVKAWTAVTDAVHEAGTPIICQLWHIGLSGTPGKQVDPSVRLVGPSGLNLEGNPVSAPMTQREIDGIIEAFGYSAEAAKRAGFDGVELHAGHGYLIDQFFWDRTNRRSDRYGGGIGARTRFAVEVLQEIRSRVGADFPISLRFSQWKIGHYGARIAENPTQLAEWLEPLADAGLTMLHASQRRFWQAEFAGSDLNLAGWAKKITGLPTITVGSVTFEQEDSPGEPLTGVVPQLTRLEEMLCRGDFDLVAVGRAVIANPDWAHLVSSGAFDQLATFDRIKAREVLY